MTTKEYNSLIEEAYNDYVSEISNSLDKNSETPEEAEDFKSYLILSLPDFVEEIRDDNLFSDKRKLKIEESDLTIEERISLFENIKGEEFKNNSESGDPKKDWAKHLDDAGVPSKVIVTSYKDNTIISYA